jgi:hypothetical protein
VSKDRAGAEVEADPEVVGEALEVSDGDSVGEALVLGDALVLDALADGVELEVPPQAVRASSAAAAVAVAAIDRRAPRAPCTVPVSSLPEPRHQRQACAAPDRDSGDLGG